MKIEKLAPIAEIVSSVAIVMTLAYLAVQAQQTNDMLLGNSRQALIMADLTYGSAFVGLPTEVINQMGLGEPQVLKANTMFIMFMRTLEFAWLQYRSGILDEDTFESYMSALDLISEEGGKKWALAKTQLDPGFADYVDARLATKTQ